MLIDDISKRLQVTDDANKAVLAQMIEYAKSDLEGRGITKAYDESDPKVAEAISVYCQAMWDTDKSEIFLRIFNQMAERMASMTGYTEWGDDDD